MSVESSFAAIERDLLRTGKIRLSVTEKQKIDDPHSEFIWLKSKSQLCTGIVFSANISESEQLAHAAGQIQEYVHEELNYLGMPVLWPECSIHRNSHPLDPINFGGEAWWSCPKTKTRIAKIGELKA